MTSSTDGQKLGIDIFIDPVCPWCFIGKRRLEKALELLDGEIAVSLRWRSFQLDPTLGERVARRPYLERKYGSAEALRSAETRIVDSGRPLGIAFNFDRIAYYPNSRDALRLIRWAGQNGSETQTLTVDTLFRAYHEMGSDISSREILVTIAVECGLDGELIQDLLGTERDHSLIENECDSARRAGIESVPCFVVDNRFAVVGAQSVDHLVGVLRDVSENRKAES